ncbi:MAG: SsrA-binding protein [Candidatus Omnitrophota bacterium]|nr:MAG: SsrA-binding protein [Candidatus Omnitrophota bacterium]
MRIENKKAFHDYEILERIEAGIVLKGAEVKSLREGKASLKDSYGKIENGEIFLHNFYIAPYPASFEKIDPLRKKKLLLHKNQIIRLGRKVEEKGLTIVPLSVYFNSKGLAKVEIALAKGKKLYDKRKEIKKREVEREIQRRLKEKW